MEVRLALLRDPIVSLLIEEKDLIPEPVVGDGPAEVVVIGQDPTTQRTQVRERTTRVFDWDHGGPIKNYVTRICRDLGADPKKNLYCTNLLKCFFREPPAGKLRSNHVQRELLARAWLPLLARELDQFSRAVVISLGEPVYRMLCHAPTVPLRMRWGHRGPRISHGTFASVNSEESKLQRTFFPFPHVTTSRKPFYSTTMPDYLAYVRSWLSENAPAIR